MTKFNILGIDHIYISVSNLERSEAFYDKVMSLLGFRKGTLPINSEPHIHYYNRYFQLTIRPAKPGTPTHNPYAPGLHHLCFQVDNSATVDAIAKALIEREIEVSLPQFYPEYAPDYYAIFFSYPDEIRLELNNFYQERREIYENWNS